MGASPLLAVLLIGLAVRDDEIGRVLRSEFREILFFAIALALVSMIEAAEIVGAGGRYSEKQKTRMLWLGAGLAVALFFYAVTYGGFVASGRAEATSAMVAWALGFDILVLFLAIWLRIELWRS
jgi:hypothetical protein